MRDSRWFSTLAVTTIAVAVASTAAASAIEAQRPVPPRAAPPVTRGAAPLPQKSDSNQPSRSKSRKKAPKAPRWRFSAEGDVTLLFDSNPFLLNAGSLSRVDLPRRSDSVSGRFADMQSASDLRLIGRVAAVATRKATTGRELRVEPWIEFDRYTSNTERQRTSFGVQVEQALRHQGALSVAAAVTPSYFVRNYLVEAIDLNRNGRISSSERRYARGEYAERTIEIEYARRLRKASKADPLAMWLQLGVGYQDRPSAAPFEGRSLSGPTAGLGVRFKHRNGVEADTRYEAQLLGSPVSQQIVLLDEAVFDTDFNRNGNLTDANVRTIQRVDRSRTAHNLRQRVRFPISDVTAFNVELGLRMRRFGSAEPFDVANNGRRDQRLRVGGNLTHAMSDALRIEVGARYDGQRLNRRTDLGAEGAVDDFARTQAWLGVRLTP